MAFLLNEVGKFLPSAAAISAYAKGVGASTTGRALLGMMFGELIQTHLERVGLADINEAPNDGRMANATGEVIFPGVQFSPARVLDDTQTIKRNKVRIYARKIVLDKQIYITPEMNTPDFRQAGQGSAAMMASGTNCGDTLMLNAELYNLRGIVKNCGVTAKKIVGDDANAPTTAQIQAFRSAIEGAQQDIISQVNNKIRKWGRTNLVIRANLKGLRMLVWMYSAFITPVGARALEQGIVGYFLGMPIRFDNWIGMSYAKDATADYSGNAINVDEDFDLTNCDILMCMRNCYRFWVGVNVPQYQYNKAVVGDPFTMGWFAGAKVPSNDGIYKWPTPAEVGSKSTDFKKKECVTQAQPFYFAAS